MIVASLIYSLPMLADVGILALFYFSIFGVACLELFQGQLLGRCGSPSFAGNFSGPIPQSVREPSCCAKDERVNHISPQNISYSISDYGQVCKGPLIGDITWDNSTGVPMSTSWSYIGGVMWGYSCQNYASDNPNDPNFPYWQTCVPYGNPDIGGFRNFDNILIAWIQIVQHVSAQDW